jgi:CheY-like chemotaxis protein
MRIKKTTIHIHNLKQDKHILSSFPKNKQFNYHEIHTETELTKTLFNSTEDPEILIFFSDLSNKDFELIKALKLFNFNLDIIILSFNNKIEALRRFSKLNIFSIHKHSINPSILNLDLEIILKKNKKQKNIPLIQLLFEKNKTVLDLDLFISYKRSYINLINSKALKTTSCTKIKTASRIDEIISNIKSLNPNFDTALAAPKVLIIEDDKNLNTKLCSWLKRNQYICKKAHSSTSALEKISSNHFDIILLDIGLPDYTGDEIIKKIHAINSKSCIIVLTGYKDSELLTHCIHNGAQDFITKPFIPSELLESIDTNLKLSLIRSLPDSTFNSFFNSKYFNSISSAKDIKYKKN